jgi:hypothetical protein
MWMLTLELLGSQPNRHKELFLSLQFRIIMKNELNQYAHG